jgi:hypothetical protein
VTTERIRDDPGVESVLVDGTKRRKTLLYEASLLSMVVFLATSHVAAKDAEHSVTSMLFMTIRFISYGSEGN